MGNYRFKLSDMMPNAWFYKLRDMSKTKTTTTTHHKKPPPASYHSPSTTEAPPQSHQLSHPTPTPPHFQNSPKYLHYNLNEPPRKSSKRSKPNRKTIYKPSPKHISSTESTQMLQDFFQESICESPSSESTHSGLVSASWSTSCTCRVSSSTCDIIIDVIDQPNDKTKDDLSGLDLSPVKLPSIITKPANCSSGNLQSSLPGKKIKESNQTPARKSVSGVKLRLNSPKLAVSKRFVHKSTRNKNLSESFAIVKSTFDPQKDFMESMKEMIVENNIRAANDLEELLACYLSLNSVEYHDVIVKSFEQIWFRLPDL